MKQITLLLLSLSSTIIFSMDSDEQKVLCKRHQQDEHCSIVERDDELSEAKIAKKARSYYDYSEFEEKICCIDCDPTPEMLSQLEPTRLSGEMKEFTLCAIDNTTFIVPQSAVELSGKWNSRIPYCQKNWIEIGHSDSDTVRCLVNCLIALVNIKPSQSYGKDVHIALKPLLANSNIIKLFALAYYLEIPALFKYLQASVLAYILKEENVNTLGSFLKIATKHVSRKLLDDIGVKLLKAQRSTFIRHFNRPSVNPLCTLSEGTELEPIQSSALGLPSFALMVRQTLGDLDGQKIIMCFRLLGRKLGHVNSVQLQSAYKLINPLTDRQGRRIVGRVAEGEHRGHLAFITDPASQTANIVNYGTRFDQKFLSQHGSYLYGCDKQVVLVDPNLPDMSITFTEDWLVALYNGKSIIAINTADFTRQGEIYTLWHYDDQGSLAVKSRFLLPLLTSDTILDSERIVSLLGTYLFCRESSTYTWAINTIENTPEKKLVPSGKLLACTDGGLVLIEREQSLILYDVCQAKSIPLKHPLLSREGASIHKAFFSENESLIYVIVEMYNDSGRRTESTRLHTLMFDLYATADHYTLAELVSLLKSNQVGQSEYLRKLYGKIPAQIRLGF